MGGGSSNTLLEKVAWDYNCTVEDVTLVRKMTSMGQGSYVLSVQGVEGDVKYNRYGTVYGGAADNPPPPNVFQDNGAEGRSPPGGLAKKVAFDLGVDKSAVVLLASRTSAGSGDYRMRVQGVEGVVEYRKMGTVYVKKGEKVKGMEAFDI